MIYESRSEHLAEELASALAESEEYRNYQENLAKLKERPDLYNQANEFRKRHFVMQNGGNERMMNDDFYSFSDESRRLREETLINDFLDAEVALGRLVQRIKRTILSKIDFDCDFLK